MILGALRRLARNVGIEAYRANYLTTPELRIVHFLDEHKISCVLDIGANTGQFASGLLSNGYKGRVISIEPLPEAHKKLAAASMARQNWDVAPPLALGAASGTALFHVAGNSVSSSLLSMSQTHLKAEPNSREIETIEVPVQRLDDVFDSFAAADSRIFLKIDTQGSEFDVLKGAPRTLERMTGLMLELSLLELYHGQKRFEEMHALVRELGFELWDLMPGFRDPTRARLLQIDGIYFRPGT